MKQYDLLIFGATRNTGLLIAQQAKEKDFSVAAMVRSSSEKTALKNLDVALFEGDAFEVNDCKQVIEQASPKWIVSVLGGKNSQGRRVDALGNLNVIHGALATPMLTRFLLMTSMGCGEQFENSSEQVKKFLGEALLAKTEAENALKESNLPWTILRPGGLNHNPASGQYHLLDKPDQQYEGYLSRADVAAATLELLADDKWLHRTITVQGDLKKKETA